MTYRSRFDAISLHGWLRLAFAFLVMVTEAMLRGLLWFLPTFAVRGIERAVSKVIPGSLRGGALGDAAERERERGTQQNVCGLCGVVRVQRTAAPLLPLHTHTYMTQAHMTHTHTHTYMTHALLLSPARDVSQDVWMCVCSWHPASFLSSLSIS